jgi:hypothetical protein
MAPLFTGLKFGFGRSAEVAVPFGEVFPIMNTSDSAGQILSSGVRNDPNASSLVLAVPMNGTNGGTTFTDQVPSGRTSSTLSLTPTSTTTSTSQSKYYGSSGSFGGSGQINVSGTLFSTSVWTFEAWLYMNSGSGMDLLTIAGNNCSWHLSSTGISCDGNGTARVNYSGLTIPTSTWFHFVQVNNNGTYKVYINGVGYNASSTGSGIPSGSLSLGNTRSDYNIRWNGYMQDVRLYQGLVKYASNFTP